MSSFTGVHGGNLVTLGLHRSSRLVSIHLASNDGRVVVKADRNVLVQFPRRSIHSVKEATANIGKVDLDTNSRIIKVRILRSSDRVLVMAGGNCKGHAPTKRCHIRKENNGKVGAYGVASGGKDLISVGTIAKRRSIVLVAANNMLVQVTIGSVSAVKEGARNIELVHVGRSTSRTMSAMTGIRGRRRGSRRRLAGPLRSTGSLPRRRMGKSGDRRWVLEGASLYSFFLSGWYGVMWGARCV